LGSVEKDKGNTGKGRVVQSKPGQARAGAGQGEPRQGKARQGRAGQGKARQDEEHLLLLPGGSRGVNIAVSTGHVRGRRGRE
jgi:hypothetical protein